MSSTNHNTCLLMWVFLMGIGCLGAAAETIHVDAEAPPSGDGSNWTAAFKYLQDGLAAADPCDQIWVAEGVYRPDRSATNPGGSGDREATFRIKIDVAIYGGFPSGGGEWQDRNPNTYETILSGDLAGNDVEVGDPCDLPSEPTRAENSFHIVISSNTDETAILDGFTITGGNCVSHGDGAGMYNHSGSPKVVHCIFRGNTASSYGGGMYNRSGSPTVSHCTFSGNTTSRQGGGGMCNGSGSPTVSHCTFSKNIAYGRGGGLYNNGSDAIITNCIFEENQVYRSIYGSTHQGGGGIYNTQSNPTIVNCTFRYNKIHGSAGRTCHGGGICNDMGCKPTLINCLFLGNSAADEGGGIYSVNSSRPTLTNCTFSENCADRGGAIYQSTGTVTLANCILSGDEAPEGHEIYLNWYATLNVSYSDIQDGRSGIYEDPINPVTVNWGEGNIKADPRFTATKHLSHDSPCIDAGDNTAVPEDKYDLDGDGDTTELIPWDLDGRRRFIDDPDTTDTGNGTAPIVDMGVYEVENRPPEVNAGPDQEIRPPKFSVKLNGAVEDDGLPEGFPLTTRWSKESGPGEVTFNPNEFVLDPCAVFSVPGTYVLRLTANDGELENYDEVTINYIYDVLYVDDDALGSNNGKCWIDAFIHLQDALDIATSGTEIRVAQGIYKPDLATYVTISPGDRTTAFQLKEGVILKGGYAGLDHPDQNERDIEKYQSILNGDLNGNDGPDFADNIDNSYHVLICMEKDKTAGLDGFIITGGNANDEESSQNQHIGGGMYNYHGNPTIINCIFENNWARRGGGMHNSSASSKISRCVFKGNYAESYGGGVRCSGGKPIINNCIFYENVSDFRGGGMTLTSSSPTLTNCTFYGNSALDKGGGMHNYRSSPLVMNSIFWGNTGSSGPIESAQIYGGTPTIVYCCIQDWFGSDPLFADPENGDFHLNSQAGRWDPGSRCWVFDDVSSLCIDGGNPFSDWLDESCPHGSRLNIGAYGGTDQASKSPLINVADLNNDGIVNLLDFAILAENWLWEAS